MTIPVIQKSEDAAGTKKPWESKTNWANLIMAAASFFPQIQEHLGPSALGAIFFGVNLVLRFITKTPVSLK